MALAGASLGYVQITSLATAVGLTVPANASRALIGAETKDVRFRDDGTDPTTSVGMVLATGASMLVEGAILRQLKFIEVAASAKLNVTFYT